MDALALATIRREAADNKTEVVLLRQKVDLLLRTLYPAKISALPLPEFAPTMHLPPSVRDAAPHSDQLFAFTPLQD